MSDSPYRRNMKPFGCCICPKVVTQSQINDGACCIPVHDGMHFAYAHKGCMEAAGIDFDSMTYLEKVQEGVRIVRAQNGTDK